MRPRDCLRAAAILSIDVALGAPASEDAVLRPPERLEVEPAAALPVIPASNDGTMALVDILNARFLAGSPSDTLEEAGVVVHQFDGGGFNEWGVNVAGGANTTWAAWMPCPSGQWCSKFGDRFSVSVVNARQPFLFSKTNGGIIIDSGTTRRGSMCAWATDARSFRSARTCLAHGDAFRWGDRAQTFVRRQDCIPGCTNGVEGQKEDWNTVKRGQLSPSWCASGSEDRWCPWRPHQLKLMMEQQERTVPNSDCSQYNGCRYNEVRASFGLLPPPHSFCPQDTDDASALISLQLVINASTWQAELPGTVLAVFVLNDGRVPMSETAAAQVHKTHMQFLKEFNLTDAHVPLLELDLARPNDRYHRPGPFREIRNHLVRGTVYEAA